MGEFDRRLPKNAMDALEQLSSKGTGWWPDLLANWAPGGSSGELRVAIRNGHMNFYANGQSIAKIKFEKDGSPTMCIHEKYVFPEGVNTDGKQIYIKFRGEEGRDVDDRVTYGGPEMLKKWIRKSYKHSGPEKCRIASLVEQSPEVIDLEIGLPAVGDRKSPLRMDLVSLEGASDDIRLVFWEAKMSGDARLRSRNDPEVFGQIDAYREYLGDTDRKGKMAEAYRNCCRIIRDLHSMASRVGMSNPLDPLIVAAAESDSLDVEETPRLVIFEDDKKRDETVWQEHLEVLRRKVSVAIVDESSKGTPLESIPRCGG